MKPDEALQYITQALSDYARTLPPSAAMPFQQVAQEAVTTLAQAITPPAEPGDAEPHKLRAVPAPE